MTTGSTTLTDAIRYAVLAQLNNIHTAIPGQIVSYDFTTQKATIQPSINKLWVTGAVDPLPILQNVPVVFPNSGGASLTFPVNPGDTCLLVFCERSIDDWKSNGVNSSGTVTPSDPRKLDLSDGIAIMGLKPFNSTFPNRANNSDLLLSYAGSSISIGANGAVKINTASTLALGMPGNELISQLISALTQINSVFTAILSDPPTLPNTFTAAGLAEPAIAAIIGQLTTLDGTLP